jgi:hypothetical protein
MYGHQHYVMASMLPVSLGALLTAGWVVMTVITVLFLATSLAQLLRTTRIVKP